MDLSNSHIYFFESLGCVTSLKFGLWLVPKHGPGLGGRETIAPHGEVRHKRTPVEMCRCVKFSCTDPGAGRARRKEPPHTEIENRVMPNA